MRVPTGPFVTEGFHGTDISTAYRILDEGFDDSRFETWFALSGDVWLAEQHGQKNGLRVGADQFAVVGVQFPEVAVDHSDYGQAVCLSRHEVGHVAVKSLAIYDTNTNEIIETRILDQSAQQE